MGVGLEEGQKALRPELLVGWVRGLRHPVGEQQQAIPALYFTNLISARPLMGVGGAGSLATVINAAMANQGRFDDTWAFDLRGNTWTNLSPPSNRPVRPTISR